LSAEVIIIDLDENRPQVATRHCATATVNAVNDKGETVMKMTGCEDIVAPGGTIAVCMESRCTFTWSACGPGTTPSPPPGRQTNAEGC
jgi:hypothetical protein